MFRRFIISCCALVGLTSAALGEPAKIAGVPTQDIALYVDGFMASRLSQSGSPGAMVVVVDKSGNRWMRGYGFADAARTRPMHPARDFFRIASETKVLTAIAILRQVEKGRLRLDDDVEKHLGGLRLEPRMSKPVTIRQLLQHVGGLSNIAMTGSAVRWNAPLPKLGTTLATEMPRRLRRPDVTIAYTNGAYTLLGRVLETVTGLNYHSAMRVEVFEPLGLAGASTDPRAIPRGRLVEGVLVGPTTTPFNPAGTITPPSGDAVMTAAQMGVFLEMMLNDGRLGEREILSPQLFHRMTRDCFDSNPYHDGLCLGPKRDRFGRLSFFMHGGDYISQMSGWWVIPDKGIALWIGVNSNASLDEPFFAGFVRQFFAAEAAALPPPLAGPSGQSPDVWTGIYRPNSSTMGGDGRFLDLLPPAADVTVQALSRDRISINGLPYRHVVSDLYRRELGASPDGDMIDYESRKLVRFFKGPEGETQFQRSDRSATRIASWQAASVSLAFASLAIPLFALVGLFAVGAAFWSKRVSLALAGGACLIISGSLFAYMQLPAYGVQLLYGLPASVQIARLGFWLAGALAIWAFVVSVPKLPRAAEVVALICAIAAILTVGWAACWEMI
jgi:CubicO group peptidase (beta-lactamase class C family)